VNSDDPAMSYHIRGPIAVPHCDIKLHKVDKGFPIKSVMVGPGPHQVLAFKGVAPLAFHAGVKSVTLSLTPFRRT
jgi:hypothetical protein